MQIGDRGPWNARRERPAVAMRNDWKAGNPISASEITTTISGNRPSRPQPVSHLERGECCEPERERRHESVVDMTPDACKRAPQVGMAASESPSSIGS